MTIIKTTATVFAFLLATHAAPAFAQAADPAAPAASAQPPADKPANDRAVDPSEPDFTLIGLPTTLRMPRFASAFRVTHRFTRPLGQGDFGDLLSDGLGTDGGAQIGLEYRIGIMSGTQVGVSRVSGAKTIEFFLQQQLLQQKRGFPVTVDAIAAIEGINNFHDSYSPALGAVVSRTLGRHGAVYLEPIWVNNTNGDPSELVDNNDTFILGIGGRVRIRPTVYIVAEAAPHFGYKPDVMHGSFAIEKRAGGHSFQLNFSNGFGSTLGQIARGGISGDNWYFGFNISRKFF
jgi:hypothetical protein